MSRLLLILYLFAGAAMAASPVTPPRGFLVFTESGAANYVPDAKGRLQLQGKAPGRIDEFASMAGRIYRMERLPGKVAELGPDLKSLQEVPVKSKTGIPYWLGVWNGGLLVLNDNAVVYLDGNLRELARLNLEPGRLGRITPVLYPEDFDTWEDSGYLLANSGEVFVVPLKNPKSSAPLHAAFRSGEKNTPQGQWVDPEERTLNYLIKMQREEYDATLKPGERRVIKEEIVLTYDLGDLQATALRTVVHEAREIHEPVSINPEDGGRPDGMIVERRPSHRAEGPDQGTHIGVMSRTTPAYAEAFLENPDAGLPPRAIVRLKSRGRYEAQTLMRDTKDSPVWFQTANGRRYIDSDLQEHVLRLHPEPYAGLDALPELRGSYFKVLAY